MRTTLILLAAPLMVGATGPSSSLDVQVEGLRNARGVIHACLVPQSPNFPDCAKSPQAVKTTVPASERAIHFTNIAPGRYAVTLIHDENQNGKLDTMVGIPREGFGFSRNPVIRFGAPKFSQVDIELPAGFTRQMVRMQYLL